MDWVQIQLFTGLKNGQENAKSQGQVLMEVTSRLPCGGLKHPKSAKDDCGFHAFRTLHFSPVVQSLSLLSSRKHSPQGVN